MHLKVEIYLATFKDIVKQRGLNLIQILYLIKFSYFKKISRNY